MIFFLFSYNRGSLLRNCVASFERCAPPGATLIVYDDNSNDPETLAVLADVGRRHQVRSLGDTASKSQHGALYTNMQRAIDSLPEDDELIFFIQDDAQLIRPIGADDLTFLRDYFASNPRAGFLSPVFQRRITKQRTRDRFVYDSDSGVYICRHHSKKAVAGVYYSDISITSSRRLRELGWRFLQTEYDNELQAKAHFHEMGYLFAPLAMQLPNAPAYRSKKKSLAFRLAEKWNRSGLYAFRYMTDTEVAQLKTRPVGKVPVAEDYLVTDPPLKTPWIFHPLRRSKLLRKLDLLETSIKRRF